MFKHFTNTFLLLHSPLRPCRRQFPRVMPLSKPGKKKKEAQHGLFCGFCRNTAPPDACRSCCCRCLWAADSEQNQEKTLELIRYLVPDKLNGALVDSLSGHALSAAGLAASFLMEANEPAWVAVAPSICSVVKAQTPGWFHDDPRQSWHEAFFLMSLTLSTVKNRAPLIRIFGGWACLQYLEKFNSDNGLIVRWVFFLIPYFLQEEYMTDEQNFIL